MQEVKNKKLYSWVILIGLALIWGSSFILMKRGNEVFSWEQVAALRIFIAFLFLIPFMFNNLKKGDFKDWKGFLAVGLFGNFIPAFLFTRAEMGLSSSLTGMLNSLTPLFTLIIGVLFFQSKTKLINVIGVIIGFIGAIGLISAGKDIDLFRNFSFAVYVIIATICYGLSVNIIKRYLSPVNPVTITTGAFLLVGPPAGLYLFITDFITRLSTPFALEALGFICILAIFGTALSVILFNMLIKNTTALFASSVTYLIPIVAMFWGIFDGEHIDFLHFMWILLILAGIYLVNKKTA